MPVLNEERYLAESVRRVLAQEYDGEVEIVLAVGPSKDRTAAIAAELAASDPRIVLVDNPVGRTPHALNAAIAATRHPYVVRVDAHGFLPEGYLRDVAALLDATGAANVGGMMRVEGETSFGKAVAVAMSSPLGIGGSKFHVGGEPGPARTVYLGAFRRDVLVELGGFDEHFLRAQDWELNFRIRQAGHTVWFTPHLAVTYRPRRDFRALRRQFFGSGQWRRQIVDAHPETASVRYLAAPVVTGAIGARLAARAARRARPGRRCPRRGLAAGRVPRARRVRRRRAGRDVRHGPRTALAGAGAAARRGGHHAPRVGRRLPPLHPAAAATPLTGVTGRVPVPWSATCSTSRVAAGTGDQRAKKTRP